MLSQQTYRKIRTSIIVISLTFGTGAFWATVAAGIVRYVFNASEGRSLVFAGGPVFVLYCIWCVRRLPGMLRKSGYIE